MNNRDYTPFQIRKSNKQDDHLPVWDVDGHFLFFVHPALLRKIKKENKGQFISPASPDESKRFILSRPYTKDNYPELGIPGKPYKDNIVTTQTSEAVAQEKTASERFMDKVDARIDEKVGNAQRETFDTLDRAFQNMPKGSIPDVGESKEPEDYSKYWEPSGIPTPNTPEVEAYFTPVNQRHRFLNNIKVMPFATNIGETYYQIEAEYAGETEFLKSRFNATIKCTLTLSEYESGISLKEGKWQTSGVEKWLGTYEAKYKEWRDVPDIDGDYRALHAEVTREESSGWLMHYHHSPIEAINYIMTFNPQQLPK